MKIKTILLLAIFSIAMGYMESVVVIYLRKIYYPNGFNFPLVSLDANIGVIEFLREAATIVMLLMVGILTGKTTSTKFASFIFCFAIWDIFYYIFLWIFLGWPQSLFTWDILFLIPVPWVGPVITPCIVSFTMMLLALSIIHFQKSGLKIKLILKEWILFITGSAIIILSFIWDYLKYKHAVNTEVTEVISGQMNMFSEFKNYVPENFNWPLFLSGELIIIYGIIILVNRIKLLKHINPN